MKRASILVWEKYGKQLIALFLLLVVYLFLEEGVTYSIETDKDTYSIGEVVNATVIVHNPFPIPIWYSGYRSITLKQEPGEIKQVTISTDAIEAVHRIDELRNQKVSARFLAPGQAWEIRDLLYLANEENVVTYTATIKNNRVQTASTSIEVSEFKPVGVTVNSTGITLFLEASRDPDNPTILIRVRNDNPYPVVIPTFSPLKTRYGSIDNDYGHAIFIEWVYPHWNIPTYSTKTIYDTDAYASNNRTPVYYILYGLTLSYPPE